MAQRILVYADRHGLPATIQIGTLTAELVRGRETFSFAYTRQWLQSGFAPLLDRDLQLFDGPQFPLC